MEVSLEKCSLKSFSLSIMTNIVYT